MWRWVVSVVGVTGLFALAFLLAHGPQRTPGLTEAKFQRVQRGMTLEQAEAILGGFARYNPGPAAHYWYGDSGTAFVVLDEVGRVRFGAGATAAQNMAPSATSTPGCSSEVSHPARSRIILPRLPSLKQIRAFCQILRGVGRLAEWCRSRRNPLMCLSLLIDTILPPWQNGLAEWSRGVSGPRRSFPRCSPARPPAGPSAFAGRRTPQSDSVPAGPAHTPAAGCRAGTERRRAAP